MSETERLRIASDTAGSAATVEWPSRLSVPLIFASAPCGCLRASQCTDSGTKKNTSGMNTSVTDGAELEHVAPVRERERRRRDEAAERRADWIADRHDRDAPVAALRVRELRGHRVDSGEHAADAEAGDHPPGREVAEPVVELVVEQGGDRRHEPAEHAGRLRDHEHAGRHDDEAPQDRRPPANLVREAAEENRAERHAQELRGQHEAE